MEETTDQNEEPEEMHNGSVQLSSDFHVEGMPSSTKFHIDTSKIQAVPVAEQNDELLNLGLQVYNQETFEQGVLAQVDELIETEERERMCGLLNKELGSIDEDIRSCQLELADIDKVLSMMEKSNDTTKETKHRVISIKSQQRNATSRLQTLSVRRKMTLNKLKDAETIESASQDTGQEDLVRRGEMTPFGTMISSGASGSKAVNPSLASKKRQNRTSSHLKKPKLGHDTPGPKKEEPPMDDHDWKPQEQSDDYEYSSSDDETLSISRKKRKSSNGVAEKKSKRRAHMSQLELAVVDDGDDEVYQQRIRLLHKYELLKQKNPTKDVTVETSDDSDMEIDGGFKIPSRIWNKLYRYQKTGVRWLWELHCQQAGGILGDEMGLGKTIQVIAFLVGLRYSNLKDKSTTSIYTGLGPVVVVCPATVMHQWVNEFHHWWPSVRVAVLHATGSYHCSEAELIKSIVRSRGVLITAYSTVVIQQDLLLGIDWHYIFLDEGHKIRNPDAQVTLACKQFRTCHRIVLSGSPIQNNLKELWSLFDFVFPGKLGTLPDFMLHFSVPIVQGGYANATEIQVQTAYKCACILRDTIAPYLLRRMKADVKVHLKLPNKNEQVLFCRLTEEQRQVYKEYLDSKECQLILNGNYMVFPGLITLRKICNHPDLSTGGPKFFAELGNVQRETNASDEFGYWKRSGKMVVIESLLKLWKKQQHKVLLFSQSRQMLDILESFVNERQYSYLRMDGTTSIGSRQPMVARFNNDESIFLFLLTTRVGGLGVNLTGADRVVIFDPDWNPSTDMQARERAWRIGQTKPVTVYRLLTTGTIEEKIYHRQIFKQFLTNRVLKDPKQRRFFKSNDLFELFTLGSDNPSDGTETSAIFAGTSSDVKVPRKSKVIRTSAQTSAKTFNRFDYLKEKAEELGVNDKEDDQEKDDSDDERVTRIKELAKLLSQRISTQAEKTTEERLTRNSEKNEDSGPDHLPGVSKKSKNDLTNSYSSSSKLTGENNSHRDTAASNSNVRRDKHKAKVHKHKRRAAIDGEKISNLDLVRPYETGGETQEQQHANDQDNYVLRKLLKKSGVHSAMLHDRIMQSSNPDYILVECEAERVARNAARALQVSRQQCLAGLPAGVPTWTGQNGLNPAQSARARFGKKKNPSLAASQVDAKNGKSAASQVLKVRSEEPSLFSGPALLQRPTSSTAVSSSELLAQMRSKKPLSPDRNQSDGNLVATTSADDENVELIRDIRCFVACGAAVDGQASTNEILEQFRTRIPLETTARFKAMLKKLCSFYKIDGAGIWKLKPEYQ